MGEGSERKTTVSIYGQDYHVRSSSSPEYIEQLAAFVDERMREVSELTPTVDTLKVAILAALNISDKYFTARRRLQAFEETVTEKAERMRATLDSALRSEST
ncbi:MAG TPA: cell division protein ZapA [Acidobacteriota bacterium]|nr:cell division protein ZapA [Acidobacteriota bacterium]